MDEHPKEMCMCTLWKWNGFASQERQPITLSPWIEEWSTIVWKTYVSNGQHLSLTRIIEAIRESWSTSTMNGGLDINFVKQCIESYNSCSSHETKRKMPRCKCGMRNMFVISMRLSLNLMIDAKYTLMCV